MGMDLDTFRYMRNRERRTQRTKLTARIRNLNPTLANDLENLSIPWFAINEPKVIKNQTSEDTTEVFIYEEIDWFWGLSADAFVQELNDITTDNIDLRLNSPGGDVFDSIAIYNALVKHPANVTVYVDSLAASGASVIAMAGDKVVMMVGSQMMIHDAMGIEMGNAAQLREYADFLSDQSDNIAGIYANRAGGEISEWRDKMLAETWAFAQEAVEIGLADEVYEKPTDQPEPDEDDGDESEEDDDPPMPPGESEEDPDDVSEKDLDNTIAALLKTKHSVTNRGWKFNGRRKAPAPVSNSNNSDPYDSFVAKLRKA